MRNMLLVFLLLSNILLATSYGLIIGIGKYKDARIPILEGVEEDIETYRAILKQKRVKNIVVLKNRDATQKKILDELEKIANNIKKGDRFFMFFSGHGASLNGKYSEKFRELGLDSQIKGSGAILPYDFNSNINRLSKTIIIGRRDLNPLIKKIDGSVTNSLVVFDACFARETIKDVKGKKNSNHTPNIITEDKSYPYSNIVYIASSIIEAKPKTFSPILKSCLKKDSISKIEKCINEKDKNEVQFPAVIRGKSVITLR